jgi:TRAP-type uncharacterized transport system substrate-binding protein
MLKIGRRRLIAAAPALALAGAFGRQRQAQARTFVRIATAGSGGNYDRLGAGMAALWDDRVPGVQVSPR